MKAYTTPEIKLAVLTSEDVITASITVQNGEYLVGAPESWWTGNE